MLFYVARGGQLVPFHVLIGGQLTPLKWLKSACVGACVSASEELFPLFFVSF